ncbi:MAG: sigma-70 family RNA polymerase sigma factor [Planctomycetota bacterium]
MSSQEDITKLLADLRAGNKEANESLLALLYDELHVLAERFMRSQRSGHTLQPTALVHEVYLKLGGEKQANWENRTHFLRVAAKAMRQVLINYALRRGSEKREGKWTRRSIDDVTVFIEDLPADFIDLGNALNRLAEVDPQIIRVVDLRFFSNMTVEETARALGISASTVKRDWKFARAWLRQELSRGE